MLAAIVRRAAARTRVADRAMAAVGRAEHWYDLRTGRPFVPEERTDRRPTAALAVKRGLLPSVTTVLSIVNRRNLDYWRASTLLQAAVEVHETLVLEHQRRLSRGQHVDEDDLVEQDIVQHHMLLQSAVDGGSIPDESIPVSPDVAVAVEQAADSIASGEPLPPLSPQTSVVDRSYFMRAATAIHLDRLRQAPELGTHVHRLFEDELLHLYRGAPAVQWPEDLEPFRASLRRWLEQHVARVIGIEVSFASKYGYGGRVDLLCELRSGQLCVCDFKTQGSRTGRVTWHSEWPCQLAAYAVGADMPNAALVNVVFNTSDAYFGECTQREWASGADNLPYWTAFTDVYRVWCGPLGRNFRPSAEAIPSLLAIPGTWDAIVQAAAAPGGTTVFGKKDVAAAAQEVD